MPKIPIDQQQISLNVRDAGNVPYAHEFGQLGTAIAGVGQDIEQGSLTILQQVNHAAAVDAAANKFAEMKMWANQTQTQLKLQSPDGMMHEDPTDPNSPIVKNDDNTPRTIAREFYDQANAKYKDGQDSMPSELASQMFRERALPHLSEQGALLQNEGLQMRIKYGDQQQMLRAKQLGGDLYNTPVMSPRVDPATGNPVMAKDAQGNSTGKPEMLINGNEYYDNVKNELQNINDKVGVNYNQEGAQERIIQVKHTMTEEAGRNMLNQLQIEKRLGRNGEPLDGTTKIQDIAANIAFLKGEDPQSKARKAAGLPTFSEDMDPDKRDILIGKIAALAQQAKVTDEANYHVRISNEIAALKVGVGHKDELNEALRLTAERGLSDPNKHGLEAASTIAELFGAKEMGELHKSGFYNQSFQAQTYLTNNAMKRALDKADQYAQSLGINYTQDMGGKAAEAIYGMFSAEANKTRDAVQKDSVGFMTTPSTLLKGSTPMGDLGLRVSKMDYNDLMSADRPENVRTYQQFSQAMGNSPHDDGRRLSIDNSKLIGSKLQDVSPGGYSEIQAGQIVAKLRQQWGTDYGRNVQQMINDGSLPPKYSIMALHTSDDPLAQQYLMSQLRKTPAMIQADEANAAAAGVAKDAVISASNQQTLSWIRSRTKSDPNSNLSKNVSDEMEGVIRAGAFQEIRSGTTDDPKTAAKMAYDKLIGKFTVNVDHKNYWAENLRGENRVKDYIIPSNFNGVTLGPAQISVIHANINYDAKHLEQFNPTIPSQPPGTSPDLVKKLAQAHMDMINRTAYPVPSTDGRPGTNFLYTTKSGQVLPVTQNVNGKEVPVFVPLEKSLTPRPQAPSILHKVGRFMGLED